jgi:hypothetical protein
MHLQLDPMQFGVQTQSTLKAGPGSSYMEAGLKFYQLSVALSDLSVYQTIVYIPEGEGAQSASLVRTIEWDKVVHAKHSLYASLDLDDIHDFVVPDGLDDLAAPVSKADSQVPKRLAVQDPNASNRCIDNTLLYTVLTSNTSVPDSTEVNVILNRIEQMFIDTVSLPSGTL